MTSYLAVTTCNAEQWERFGRAMVRTFARHWPQAVRLEVHCEGFWSLEDIKSDAREPTPWIGYTELYEAAPWLATFKALYRDPQYNGGSNGRDYRHDAVRFAHKVAALGAAAEDADCDVLIWIDADVVTHASVTVDWLESLFPEPAVVAWLDRDNCYPECGFLMFRMPSARKVIREVVKSYRNGSIFKLPEWHDSYVIQHVVQKSGVAVHSLSGPEGRKHRGHPWIASELAAKMDHLKGERRKHDGRSALGQELKSRRTEAYWR